MKTICTSSAAVFFSASLFVLSDAGRPSEAPHESHIVLFDLLLWLKPCPAYLTSGNGTRAQSTEDRIFVAKIRIQFGLQFEMEEKGGILFAFQNGISEKKKKYLGKLPVKFSDTFKKLVGTKADLNKELKIVIFDSKSTYNNKFSVSGLFGHYHSSGKTIYTYKNSGAGTLYHELAHHYIRVVYGENIPLWFDEGLASYFEKTVGGGFGYTNWRLPILKKGLKKGKYIELGNVLDGTQSDDRFFLAEVRHFFVFLDHLGVMEEFLVRIKKRKDFSCKDLVEELTGMSVAELDAVFRGKIHEWEKNEYVGSAGTEAKQ